MFFSRFARSLLAKLSVFFGCFASLFVLFFFTARRQHLTEKSTGRRLEGEGRAKKRAKQKKRKTNFLSRTFPLVSFAVVLAEFSFSFSFFLGGGGDWDTAGNERCTRAKGGNSAAERRATFGSDHCAASVVPWRSMGAARWPAATRNGNGRRASLG